MDAVSALGSRTANYANGECEIEIPADFARRIERTYGGEAKTWLLRLPARIAKWERRWSLSVCPPVTPLKYGYVAAKGEDGDVDKLGFFVLCGRHYHTSLRHSTAMGSWCPSNQCFLILTVATLPNGPSYTANPNLQAVAPAIHPHGPHRIHLRYSRVRPTPT